MSAEKVSKYIVYTGIVAWCLMATFQVCTQEVLVGLLGGIALFLGLKNLYFLRRSLASGEYHSKLAECVNRMGARNGLIYYAVWLVALFIIVGVLMIFYGFFYS